MKNLDLMGVQEMDAVEMRNVGGGSITVAIIIALTGAAVYLYDNRDKVVEGFKEGYQQALND